MFYKLVRTAGAAIISSALSLSMVSASELRNSLDHTLSSGNLAEIEVIAREHTNVEEQEEILSWIQENVDNGKAPDTFAQVVSLAAIRRDKIEEALTYLSYYRALIMIDGVTCKDPSSGGSLIEATIFFHQSLLNRKQQTTTDQKKAAVERAIKLEERSSKVRRKDPALCGSGLTAYAKDLNVPFEPAGSLGRDTSDMKFSANRLYADDPLWQQKRQEQLPNLRNFLLLLVGAKDGQ